jgi:hypothetical protein
MADRSQYPIIYEEKELREPEDFSNTLRDSIHVNQNHQINYTPIRKSLELENMAKRLTTEWIEEAKRKPNQTQRLDRD